MLVQKHGPDWDSVKDALADGFSVVIWGRWLQERYVVSWFIERP